MKYAVMKIFVMQFSSVSY